VADALDVIGSIAPHPNRQGLAMKQLRLNLSTTALARRRTRIVATVGPSSSTVSILKT
jgi:hypothetical protein